MRIVFLVRALDVGGAERQLANLAVGLHGRGHAISVHTLYSAGPLEAELRQAGIPVEGSGKRSRWDLLRPLAALAGGIRRRRPELVYAFLTAAQLAATGIRPFLPGVRVVWGVRASNMELDRYGAFQTINFALACGLSRYADLIVCNSESGRRYHVDQGMPADRTCVIPNGIDVGRFVPRPEEGRRLRAAWQVPEAVPLIGIAARLDPMKDHPTFLEAARRFLELRPTARFVCLGEGPAAYRESLQARASALGLENRVRWAGRVDEMPAAFSALDLATSSSAFGEGFPNVLGEAMACGVPCVATDVGDSARVVGELGRIVPPGRPQALAVAWHQLLDRRQAWAGSPVRDRIVNLYSLESMIDRSEQRLAALSAEAGA